MSNRPLAIAGLTKLSTVDWPDKLVATVFLQGCPWNCLYCHNPDLIDSRQPGVIAWAEVLDFLATRRGLLDGVVFTGGEATRQDLRDAIGDLRRLGFAIGLHTNGAYPARLAQVIDLVDWVGFDVKGLPGDIETVTRTTGATTRLTESLQLLLASSTPYQVRTTWGPGVPTVDTIERARAVQDWLRSLGVVDPVLQPVRLEGTRPDFLAAQTGRPESSGPPLSPAGSAA